MNPAMLAQAALERRKRMKGKNAEEHVVVASGTRKASTPARPVTSSNHIMQKHYMPGDRGRKAPPIPSATNEQRGKYMTKPKYGGFFPQLDSHDKPILNFLMPDIIKKAEQRSLRLLRTNNQLKVSLTCPFPGYEDVEEEAPQVSNGHGPFDISAALNKLQKVDRDTLPQYRRRYKSTTATTTTKGGTKTKKVEKKKIGKIKITMAYTDEEMEESWTEHAAPNGTKYYYNSITEESTYTKPDCFAKKEEAVKSSPQEWEQFSDLVTGKFYYSDGITTTWDKPPGM